MSANNLKLSNKNMKEQNNMNTKQEAIQTAFVKSATDFSTKLTFNTREEYLTWVKQWKEDYKLILLAYTTEKYKMHMDICILPDKIAHYKKKLILLKSVTDEQNIRIQAIKTEYLTSMGYSLTGLRWTSLYSVLQHLYITRKAGKIRAAKKREERIVSQLPTA